MRKVKALELLAAAAVAAVPTFSFAEVDGAPAKRVQQYTPLQAPLDYLSVGAGSKFRLANPSWVNNGGPDANVDGTFLNGVNDPGDGLSWQVAANWSTNPQIPDGTTAIARFNALSGGISITPDGTAIDPVTLSGTTVNLQRLDMNDPLLTVIANGNLVLNAPATIEAQGNFLDPPGVVFSGINQLGTATQTLSIGGSAGLNKIGDSPIQLNSANTFSGPVNISGGGKIINAAGDPGMGNAANSITLNNGTFEVFGVDMTTSRTINIGAGGGHLWWVGAARTFTHSGDITGSGQLLTQGAFGTPGPATFDTAKSFSGPWRHDGGTVALSGAGAMTNVSNIHANGTVILAGSGVNRLADTVTTHLTGATLRIENTSSSNVTETIGNLSTSSTSWIHALKLSTEQDPNEEVITVNIGNITRVDKGSMAFRGVGLGNVTTGLPDPGAGNVYDKTRIFFNNGAASLKGGIIPWAYGNYENQFTGAPESEFNTLVTYGANGVAPITAYQTNPAVVTANENLLISDLGATINGNISANSLVLRVSQFYQADPMTTAGTGTVNLTTGVILSAHAGALASGGVNSQPGNIVNVNINAGTNEIIIHTPSAVTFTGVLAGTGGLTKAGGRTAFFHSSNATYTGETQLSGFVRFGGNVLSGVPGPFGADTSPIILHGGNFAPNNPAGGVQGTMAGILAANNDLGALTFSRPLTIRGTGVNILRNFSNAPLTFSGGVSIDAGSAVLLQAFGAGGIAPGGAVPSDQFVFSAPITGAGQVQMTDSQVGGPTDSSVTFLVANTFTGGLDAGGTIILGHNQALSTGSVTMSENVNFKTINGDRTIANNLFSVAGAIGFHGPGNMTWTGKITGVGGDYVLDVTNPASTTLSGELAGGGFFKTGMGTVVVNGNNTFPGTLNVGNGTIEGGVVMLRSNTAAGSTVGNSGVNAGNNTMGLDSNVQIGDELIVLRGHGVGNLGALRSFSGNNGWGGTVLAGLPNSIGVDAGSNLTLGKSWFSVGAGTNAGLATATKVGPGQLVVGSETFTAGTSNFRGAVIADSLAINGGSVRLSNVVADTHTPSVSDVLSLTIAAGSKLDMGKNAVVVDYTGASPINDIRSLIIQGYAGGAWTGNGISSSDANATEFGIGYADNTGVAPTGLNFTTFYGDPVDNTAVLAVWTRYGDANLDNFVNLADFNRLATNFGLTGGAVWSQGDFNYDGNVNLQDFNRLAANFGLSAGPDGPSPEDWAALGAAVPEPAALSLVAVAGLGLLKRRRRDAR